MLLSTKEHKRARALLCSFSARPNFFNGYVRGGWVFFSFSLAEPLAAVNNCGKHFKKKTVETHKKIVSSTTSITSTTSTSTTTTSSSSSSSS